MAIRGMLRSAIVGLTGLLGAGCGDSAPATAEGAGGVDEQLVLHVASGDEVEGLVAWYSGAKNTLFVTDEARLGAAVEAGHWEGLQYAPGASRATLLVAGQAKDVPVLKQARQDAAEAEPELGDLRFLDVARKSWREVQSIRGCVGRNEHTDPDDDTTETWGEYVDRTAKNHSVPTEARGMKEIRREWAYLLGEGDVIAPEVFECYWRTHMYRVADCATGHMSGQEVHMNYYWGYDWKSWPNP